MRLLRQPLFLAVSLGHFGVDVLNGHTGILLAVLSVPLGLRNAQIGLIAMLYSMVGSLSQPVFGWLSDRGGGRWVTAGGVVWMAACFALVAWAPGYWPLVCLVIGALGSAAFHPPGTAQAARVGQLYMAGRTATAASLFFLFGQGGLSVGPAIGGLIVDYLGREGIWIVAALVAPAGLFAWWAMRAEAAPSATDRPAVSAAPPPAPEWSAFALILLLAGLRVWAQTATTTFAPKFFQEQSFSPTVFGMIVALFMGGTALGGVAGGMLADRWGRRQTILLTMAASALPFYLFPLVNGVWIFVCALAAGLLNGASHSVLVTMAQRLLPGRASFASGVILGFMFAAGALGGYLSGLAADAVGLRPVLQSNAAIALAAALLTLALKGERAPAPAAASAD
jgi:FSR family fosmidomycin resistance protein-like MFS transporter